MEIKARIGKLLPESILDQYRSYQACRRWPAHARQAHQRDVNGLPNADPGVERTIAANLAWLCRAQDCSSSRDGGVARHYSILTGWGASYPETTGYIVPTMLSEADVQSCGELHQRGRRMLDWLISIQRADGGFPGGTVGQRPEVSVTFNTGQILLGLVAGAKRDKGSVYASSMHRAATWLSDTQDRDGCWRRYPSPFAIAGEKAFDAHASWGLFEVERLAPGKGYGEAGIQQVTWALTKQDDNGWFHNCCLNHPSAPLTHTLGYVLRGIIEAYLLSKDKIFIEASIRTADALVPRIEDDGFLAGRFCKNWRPMANWCCLTGSLQIAYCLFQLYELTNQRRYFDAGSRLNCYARRTIACSGDPNQLGGVRGSYPISGDYGQFEYLNWAAKFCIDSQRKEVAVMRVHSDRELCPISTICPA